MRRRNSGPTVNVRRQGPGLLQTAARTAVIAGTATAVSTGVQGAMTKGSREQAAAQQQALAEQQAAQQQALAEQQAAQQQAMLDQAAAAGAQQALAAQSAVTGATTPLSAPPTSSADRIAQLKDLASLKEAGILTEEEFQAEKARILAG